MVESVVAEAGKGLVGDRDHGAKHRHVTIQSQEMLDDWIGPGAAKALRQRGGSVCRLLTSGTIHVGDAVDFA